jgi:hypothetical protein
MPWAQFSDEFGDSIEALRAGVEPLGLHLLATVWCSSHLSDGELPALVAEHLIGRCKDGEALVAALVNAGLWDRTDDGYRLPFYLRDNRSREQVEADREKRETRAKEAAAKRWAKKPHTATRSSDGET